MTSTFDNCILWNAILRNQNAYDDADVMYLFMLQELDPQTVSSYYSRSEKIIQKMREMNADNETSWSEIDSLYVNNIVEQIKEKNYNALVPKILSMLTTLEVHYGVN